MVETLHFPETMQVQSNPTLITQSSIDLQQNKNQPPPAQSSKTLHTHTHTKLRHLYRSNKRKSWTHLPSSINTRNKKNKTLDSFSVLILYSYTKNRKKNSPTQKIKFSRAVAHKSWVTFFLISNPFLTLVPKIVQQMVY